MVVKKEFSSEEIKKLGRRLLYYRGIGMRWCKLEKMFGIEARKLEEILGEYKGMRGIRR